MIHRLFAVLLLAAAGCFSGYSEDAPTRPDLRVHRGMFVDDIVLTGELEAARGEEIAVPNLPSWQTSIKWLSSDGAVLKKGERVVELDNSAFASNLDAKLQAVTQAEQELQQKDAEASADLLQKQLDVDKKRADFDKAKLDAAIPREIVSDRDYEDRQTKLKRATVELAKAQDVLRSQMTSGKADRENLQIKLQSSERELKTAQAAIDSLILRAPRDGIVVIRDHPWEGRKLKEGDPVWVGFRLAQLPDTSSMQVAAALADVDDRKIAVAMPATVVLDAYPSMTFPAKVKDISAVAQESKQGSLRRMFRVVVALDRLDTTRMRPGLSARVIIRRATTSNALLVPRAALDFSSAHPSARLDGGKSVPVQVGACNAQECVVLDGLQEGERLEGRV